MTDSASDISYADEQKYGISVIPFPIMPGGKTYISRVDFGSQQFFGLMAHLPVSGDLFTAGEGRRYRPDSGAD